MKPHKKIGEFLNFVDILFKMLSKITKLSKMLFKITFNRHAPQPL